MKNKKRILPILLIAIVAISLIIWLSSLIRCEVLTKKYFEDFEHAYAQNAMLGEPEYFKVLGYGGKTAEVYYVGKGKSGGDLLTFEKKDGEWVQISWETVWSASGSASEVIWPYWWHFVYAGF